VDAAGAVIGQEPAGLGGAPVRRRRGQPGLLDPKLRCSLGEVAGVGPLRSSREWCSTHLGGTPMITTDAPAWLRRSDQAVR